MIPLLSSTAAVAHTSKDAPLLRNQLFLLGGCLFARQDTGPKVPAASPTLQGNDKQVGLLLTPAEWHRRGAD